MTGWAEHQLGVVVYLGVVLLVVLSNLIALRRMESYGRPPAAPSVSILVPARNEARSIEACVRSLLRQQYPAFEVLVLDDGSTDGTGVILNNLRREDGRLRVLTGAPLPAGWLGKHWACQQLAEAASGELILFVDADTTHHPEALANAVAAQQAEAADLVTALPYQQAGSLAEQVAAPLISWATFNFIPLMLAHRLRAPILSLTVGQFMLFRREAYEAVGGHGAVRTNPVDDIALGKRIKAAGRRWRLLDGTNRTATRMYHGLREVVSGLSRTLFAAFGGNLLLHLFIWLWLAVVFLEPPAVLIAAALQAPLAGFSVGLAALGAGLGLLLWAITCARFHYPAWLVPLYPLVTGFAVFLALRSAVVAVTGRGTWKGRAMAR